MTVCEPTFYGPCTDYATIDDVRDLCDLGTLDLTDPDGADIDLVEAELRIASRRTFLATGQRFHGCCEATIRPPGFCCCVCGCTPSVNWCGCEEWPTIPLPFLPVRSVDEVSIDGATLDPTAYRLTRDGGSLARIDGDPWPDCQNEADLTEPGTWSVTFHHGDDLPPEGVPLVAQFAAELAKACRGGDCALAPGIRVVQRDGVEFAVAEPALGSGSTGYGPLDQWITLLNGGHVTEPPRMYRPGRQSARATLVDSVSAS